MKATRKIIPMMVSLCMTASFIPKGAALADGEYADAYSAISSEDYSFCNEELYPDGILFAADGQNKDEYTDRENDLFMHQKDSWVAYNVDFGDKGANTLVMNMRPDVKSGHGSFGVFLDDTESEPIVIFDESANLPYAQFSVYAGSGGIQSYCFGIDEPITGEHTVYFKALTEEHATTFFRDFYFLSDTVSAYEQIDPDENTMAWGKLQSFKIENDMPVLPIEGGAMFVTGVDFGDGSDGTGGVGVKVCYNRWSDFTDRSGSYEVRLDGIDGPVIGTLENSTVVSSQYREYDIKFNRLITGVHTLVFAVPTNTTLAYVQCVQGTEEDIPTVPSAYIDYAVNEDNAFLYESNRRFEFDVDFGEAVPEYLSISMRPALEDAADGGVINVYIDDDAGEPAASFTVYRDDVNLTTGNTVPCEWFAPISVPEGFGGEHKIIFKSEGNARSNFYSFRFDRDVAARNAYETIYASSFDYAVHGGNTMWGGGGGTPAPYVVGFGEEGKTYYSAAYTKVNFGEQISSKVNVRLNKLSSGDGSVQVRLGSRDGEVIGTLSSADIALGSGYGDAVAEYTIDLNRQLSGVCDIVFTSDITGTFYSFRFTGEEKPAEPSDENTTYVFSTDKVSALDGGAFQAYNDGTFTKDDGKQYRAVFKNVDFGDTLSTYGIKLTARTLSKADDTNVLKFYIDSPDTEPIGEFYAKDGLNTASMGYYPIETGGINGVHDVYVSWSGQWIVNDFTCIKGTTEVFDEGSSNPGLIYAAQSSIRSSTDARTQSDGTLDNGHTVSNLGKGGSETGSISFPGLDFGDGGVEKITLRMTRIGDSAGTVRILLGGRNGEEIASLPLSQVPAGDVFHSFELDAGLELKGIHMITVTVDYECVINYIAFDFDGDPVITDPVTAINGHQQVSVLDHTTIDGGTFISSNNGGNICVYAPSYVNGIAEGGSVGFDLEVENAKYVAICAKTNDSSADHVVGITKGREEIAEITVPKAYRNGTGYYMDVYTAELENAVSGTDQFLVTMKSGSTNIAWIRFMTEQEYSEFTGRTKIALLGDSNVEYGKYTIPLREMLDINEYEIKSLGVSGRTVRNYATLPEYAEALEYAPDIVIFTLGTNDSANSCNEAYMEQFKTDYKSMISELRGANPEVRIYLQTPLPFQYGEMTNPNWAHNTENLAKVIEAIREVAADEGLEIIDIYNGLNNYGYDREELYGDDLHVNNAGGVIMARLTKAAVFPNRIDITPSSGTADEVAITADETIITERGGSVSLSADQDVYWLVESIDGGDCDKAEISQDGTVTALKPGIYNAAAVSKTDTSKRAEIRLENRFDYVISKDADLINSTSYGYRALENFREPFISGYDNGTVIMLKDIDLTNASAFIVQASSMYDTSQDPLRIECRVDSVNGQVIGSTIITKNAKDTKYAFTPYKNALAPAEGGVHDLFFILNRGTDTSGTVRTIDGIYSIGFDYGAAKNIAVFEDGVLQDTMPIVNSDYDTTEKFTGYKAGHTYKWQTVTGGNDEGMLAMAVHRPDGGLCALAVADNADGVYTAELTLPAEFNDSYTIKSIALESAASMKPILRNANIQNNDEKLRIGCIGDSITNNWNYDELGYQEYCYPKFLQAILGSEKYEVMNFGRGTSTASSYKNNPWFERAKDAACDVYIIMLGTNDSKSSQYYNAIPTDYQTIIDGLKAASPECKIYINLPVPAYKDNYSITDEVIVNNVIPLIKEVAEKNGIEALDLHTMIAEDPNIGSMYFSDGIHPNEYGQSIIAQYVKDAYFSE